MVFTSFNFLIFFPLICLLYWITPAKIKWLTLLLGSYFFYINIKPVFAILIAGVTLITYVFTRLIGSSANESRRKQYLFINIVLVLLPLFFFKYFEAINSTLFSIMGHYKIHWPLPDFKLILPIGISFYTFMAVGYSIDVYNDDIKAEKHPGILALFISFFPLILSGPIERANNMLPQFKNPKVPDYNFVTEGFKFILWGYFMKLVVSDRLGIYIDAVYNNFFRHNGTSLLFASVLYPFQLYADLGGYSLIAIGVSRIMGIKVMHNFKRPFFANSMSELWRRWHISLISWLTDYIYTPLSFSFRKYKIWGIVISLMITFLISGIWHGAALTFIVWGVMQGVFLSIEALTNKKKMFLEKKHKLNSQFWYVILTIGFTFTLFAASQVFGKSVNVQSALIIFKKIITSQGALFIGSPSTLIFGLFGVILMMMKDFFDEYMPQKMKFFDSKYKFIRVMSYSAIIILILLIGVFDGGQFIYFQF